MNLFQTSTARPVAIDRNPTDRGAYFVNAGTAPHGSTVRVTYTVPAGKKFFLSYIQSDYLRETAAAPVGLTEIFALVVTPLPQNTVPFRIMSLDNNVGAVRSAILQPGLNASAGSVISITTSDASTGGTAKYSCSFHGIEYDA